MIGSAFSIRGKLWWTALFAWSLLVIFIVAAHTGAIPEYIQTPEINHQSTEQYASTYFLFYYARQILIVIDSLHDVLLTFATIVIAFFTFALVRSTDKLWDAGERQLSHTVKSSQRELRAYVGSDEMPDIKSRDLIHSLNNEIRANIYIKNFGKTPAYEVNVKGCVEYAPFFKNAPTISNNLEWGHGGILQPGEHTVFLARSEKSYSYQTVKDSKLDTILFADSTPRWQIYGFVTYRDTFGKRHFLKFSYYLSWPTPKNAPSWYTHHYETDDKFD
jgi:hypothetical protein